VCLCVFVSVQQLLKEMTFDLVIWDAGATFEGHGHRSGSRLQEEHVNMLIIGRCDLE